MSFTANLYKFSKDNRSTGIPSGDGLTITGINYKKPTSRENPDFEFTTESMNDDFNYNYLKIHGKYFYINDVTIGNRDKFVLHCKKDVLATYRTAIHNSTQYVVRSTNASNMNGYINDTAYPMTNNITRTRNQTTHTASWLDTFKTAVIGVLGPNAGDTTTYYQMATTTLTRIIQDLYGMDITTALSIQSLELGVVKTLFDPIKYMTSCVLLPCEYDEQGNTRTIKTGYVELEVPLGFYITRVRSNDVQSFTASILYDDHPQAATRGAYLNNSPYTHRLLTVMPFGTFNIDCSKLNDYENKIRLGISMCISDGNAVLEVYTISDSQSGQHNTLLWANAQLGVHIPLYQSDSIFKQTYSHMTTQLGNLTSALQGNYAAVPGAIAQWGNYAATVLSPEVHQVGGASGTFLYTGQSQGVGGVDLPRLDSTFYEVVPKDNNLGVMICKNKRLGDMTGFNICENAKIDISGPESDREYIRNIMNTGIIIE